VTVTRAHRELICLALKKDDIFSRKDNTYLLGFIEIDKGQFIAFLIHVEKALARAYRIDENI